MLPGYEFAVACASNLLQMYGEKVVTIPATAEQAATEKRVQSIISLVDYTTIVAGVSVDKIMLEEAVATDRQIQNCLYTMLP